jgi:hypothetical protein
VAVVATVALGAALLPAAPAGAGNPWFRVRAPSPQPHAELQSVSCPAVDVCYATGWDGRGESGALLAKTTDGAIWSRITVPQPASGVDRITAVSCTSVTRCTAVGTGPLAGAPRFELAGVVLRTTDGVHWQRRSLPNTRGAYDLFDVSCAFDAHCTAIGRSDFGTPFVLRTTDGVRWVRRNPVFPGRFALLMDVDCPTALNCTAVGLFYPAGSAPKVRTLAMRTADGVHWVHVQTPNPSPSTSDAGLAEVSCVRGSLTCVAVGSVSPAPGTRRGFILRTTDSASWTRAATPAAGWDVFLGGIDCHSTTACTAVGTTLPLSPMGRPEAVLLRTTDGARWSSPSPVSERPGRLPVAVSCATPVRCVAVGSSLPVDRTNPRVWQTSLVLREQ